MEELRRNAADFLHHLWCIAGEMPFQFLKNTLWILQCEIALWTTQIVAFVEPAVTLVGALLFVPTGEIAIRVIFRVAEFVVHDEVSDESADKGNVGAGAQRHPDIGQRAGARKTRIDMDDCRAALLRFHHPAKTDRMRLSHGGAFD